MQRTAEQQAIVEHCRDTREHLLIEARAGTGKTSTLFEIVQETESTFFIGAYNKAIAVELQRKASARFGFMKLADLQISTVHSHGLKAFNKAGSRAKTLGEKLSFMLKDQLNARFPSSHDIFRNMGKIRQLVSHAKGAGFGLTSADRSEHFPDIRDESAWYDLAEHYRTFEELVGKDCGEELCVEQAIKLLLASNSRTNSIDFDDMIYLPLLLDYPIPVYDDVLIDEAQDINVTRRELMFRSVKPGSGRIIAVGDPHQAIYGFTGADTDSLNNIEERAAKMGPTKRLPLTVCWRCDAEIIRSANIQVPDIKARDGAPDGSVISIDFEQDDFLGLPAPGDAILCRLNKPNVAACLGLLRRGVRARIEGRDLGDRLLAHVRKATPAYAHQDLSLTLLDLDTYRETEVAKLVSKNKAESTIALLEDEIEAAQLLCERAIEQTLSGPASFPTLEALVADLFGDQVSKACVVLSSVHKSKGREWSRVFILGYEDYMPFHLAQSSWERTQEQNLIYVAKTRAEHNLIFVNGAQSAIDRGLHRKVASPPVVAEASVMDKIVVPAFLSHSAMEPRPDPLQPIFRYHNCSRCRDGALPCAEGNYNCCSNPIARND